MSNDPFENPADIVSNFPKVRDLKGHLVLFTPVKFEADVRSNFTNMHGSPKLQDRITTDLVVLDGPINGFDDTKFDALWISNDRIVKRLVPAVKTGRMVLGRVNTPDPNKAPGVGNPWDLVAPSEADKQVARDYITSLKEEDPFAV